MDIKGATQVEFNNIDLNSLDIVIASSGYEERCIYIAERLNNLGINKVAKRIVFQFENPVKDKISLANRQSFKDFNYEIVEISGHDSDAIIDAISKIHKTIGAKDVINILIDYSSMTRIIYSSILLFYKELDESDVKNVNLFFCYVPSEFDNPTDFKPNVFAGPINGFDGKILLPQNPIMLIIGLGYDKIRAVGLIEFFDMAYEKTFVFHTDESYNSIFSKEVKQNNKPLLDRIHPDNIYTYPLLDLRVTGNMLSSIIKANITDNRIVIAPLGPKPFTLLSLLLGIQYPEVSIYRVSQNNSENTSKRLPNKKGIVVTCSVSFKCSENDVLN